jgi:hypothetical protein
VFVNGSLGNAVSFRTVRDDDLVVPISYVVEKVRHLGKRSNPVAIVVSNEQDLASRAKMPGHDAGTFFHAVDAKVCFQVLESSIEKRKVQPPVGKKDMEDTSSIRGFFFPEYLPLRLYHEFVSPMNTGCSPHPVTRACAHVFVSGGSAIPFS